MSVSPSTLATRSYRLFAACATALVLLLLPRPASAQAPPSPSTTEGSCGQGGAACPVDDGTDVAPEQAPRDDAGAAVTLLFFWGVGCPHCEDAKPFVAALANEEPRLRVEAIEVRKDPEGRRRFLETMRRLGATAVGIPTFVAGESYVVGYAGDETARRVRTMVKAALRGDRSTAGPAALPGLGAIDPAAVPLLWLTLAIGLVDGVNPCAIWVLLVLLGILAHVRSPRRMLLYAGTFVVMSGVVYFVFMSAWATLFSLVGLTRVATLVLGTALVAMGLVNLKELIWFKKGPSLVIPDRVKPGLFRRMRAIADAAGTPAALGGIVVLAFVVNLVELGCTIGLPAIYTRILTSRNLGALRWGYLALYNVAYVVPLLVVVLVFIAARRRITLNERGAKWLKALSGVLLTAFGALFLLAPDLLLAS